MPVEDAELLRRYLDSDSQEAFAELVRRHVDLVYAVALRQVRGDVHLARDVTQVVFAALARKAAGLAGRPVLGGWLYRTTQYAAIDAVRAESRRRGRETSAASLQLPGVAAPVEIAWERVRPTLDQAISELREDDRDAVVLRFFEGKSFAEIGARLQLAENAARMRVERALARLHAGLTRRGVTSTAAALGVALGGQAGGAAPAGLASGVAEAALATVAGAPILGNIHVVLMACAAVAAIGLGVAWREARVCRAADAAEAEARRAQHELRTQLAALEANTAKAERSALAADADVLRLLKAIQDSAPTGGLPPGAAAGLAFVIDTSGSMRDPKTGQLWPAVFQAIAGAVAAHPEVKFLAGYDADGRTIFGPQGDWLACTPDSLRAIEQGLQQLNQDTNSNPVPGICRALRGLTGSETGGVRLHVCVIGDELNSPGGPEALLRQLEQLNPALAGGKRGATISAVQLPTTVRTPGGPLGNTGFRFQELMQEVARRHAGSFQLLPEAVLH